MWAATFDDATFTNEEAMYWTDISKEKKIDKLRLVGSDLGIYELTGMDLYYFVREAVAIVGHEPVVEMEIIGGINLETQTVTELRSNLRKEIVERVEFPSSEYKYSKDILVLGKK